MIDNPGRSLPFIFLDPESARQIPSGIVMIEINDVITDMLKARRF
jgi:hypothetical protein